MTAASQPRRPGYDPATAVWVLIPAVLAPVALIDGWLIAAAAQPPGYSSVSGTISDLAATTAYDRWIMTAGLAGAGLAMMALAVGLRPVRPAGRTAILCAGLGVLVVSAEPLPADGAWHALGALVGFVALAIWPVLGCRTDTAYATLRPRPARWCTGTSVLLLAWFQFAASRTAYLGLSERVLAGGDVLWLTAVVLDTVVVRGGAAPVTSPVAEAVDGAAVDVRA